MQVSVTLTPLKVVSAVMAESSVWHAMNKVFNVDGANIHEHLG